MEVVYDGIPKISSYWLNTCKSVKRISFGGYKNSSSIDYIFTLEDTEEIYNGTNMIGDLKNTCYKCIVKYENDVCVLDIKIGKNKYKTSDIGVKPEVIVFNHKTIKKLPYFDKIDNVSQENIKYLESYENKNVTIYHTLFKHYNEHKQYNKVINFYNNIKKEDLLKNQFYFDSLSKFYFEIGIAYFIQVILIEV